MKDKINGRSNAKIDGDGKERYQGAETRARLLDAALLLFERNGFHKVGLPALGKEIGVSHAAIYAYFDDKDDLLAKCCELAIEAIREIVDLKIDPNSSAEQRLRSYLDGNLEWVLKHRRYANALLSMYYFGAQSPKLRSLHLEMDRVSISRLETHLIHGNQAKAWQVRATQARASAIHSLIVGEMVKAFHFPRDMSRAERFAGIWKSVCLLIK